MAELEKLSVALPLVLFNQGIGSKIGYLYI